MSAPGAIKAVGRRCRQLRRRHPDAARRPDIRRSGLEFLEVADMANHYLNDDHDVHCTECNMFMSESELIRGEFCPICGTDEFLEWRDTFNEQF